MDTWVCGWGVIPPTTERSYSTPQEIQAQRNKVTSIELDSY